MRQLNIDLSELEMAFESGSEMISYYLDIETGEVVNISEEESSLLEIIYESYYDDQSQTVDWEKAFDEEHVPDWQRQIIQKADQIDADFGSRYIAIPSEGSREGYRDMKEFIVTARSPRLQEKLERAISGRGAFRYFKDVLIDYPTERERWFQFKRARIQERILDWLETIGIAPSG
jgi:Uncharacterised protein family (UPF0158).